MTTPYNLICHWSRANRHRRLIKPPNSRCEKFAAFSKQNNIYPIRNRTPESRAMIRCKTGPMTHSRSTGYPQPLDMCTVQLRSMLAQLILPPQNILKCNSKLGDLDRWTSNWVNQTTSRFPIYIQAARPHALSADAFARWRQLPNDRQQ